MNYEKAVQNIRSELKTYVEDSNIKSLVLGVSGGIDSTICALLAKPVCDELGIPLIGRSLPSKSNSAGENSRAYKIGQLFCTDFKEEDISIWADVAVNVNESVIDVGEKERVFQDGNIKARIRMIKLYDLASMNKGMVLSTDNYTEYLLGFSTIMGDWGDFGMIQNLWKTEVYEMSEWIMDNELNYLTEKLAVKRVIKADATDGLGISKTDLDQIMPGWKGTSRDGYKKVDDILKAYVNDKARNVPCVVVDRHLKTAYKRNWPINIYRNKIF
jgi:NAD+ synthase